MGHSAIFALAVEAGECWRISSTAADGCVDGVQVRAAAGQTLVGVAATATQPYDLFTLPWSGGQIQPLVAPIRRLLAEVRIAPTERISFIGPDGWEIEGWLVKPLHAEQSLSADPPCSRRAI